MFQKLKKLIDKKDKLNLIFLFLILIVSTFLEMIGIDYIKYVNDIAYRVKKDIIVNKFFFKIFKFFTLTKSTYICNCLI